MSKPLVAADPTSILNAARCFCLPHFNELDLKTYLLSQAVIAASPPCITPTAPVAHFESVTNSSLALKWVQPANTGSLITSYIVQLGTTAGGPYTFSQTRGAGTHGAIFTGLTSGTTYFGVVTAVSFTGCTSTSSEISTTTGGSPPIPPNGLLNGLVAYWKLDEVGANPPTFADATGNGWTGTNTGNLVQPTGGKINGGQSGFSNGSAILVSANIDTRLSTTPFTVSCWIDNLGNAGSSGAIISEWGTRNDWVVFGPAGEVPVLRASDDAAATTDATANVALPIGTYALLVFGFDGANIFIGVNNGALVKVAKANVRRGGGTFTICNYQTVTLQWPEHIDEVGYWNRALSATDISNLYNNGNALPFGSFTN